jgi:hypothetical protein
MWVARELGGYVRVDAGPRDERECRPWGAERIYGSRIGNAMFVVVGAGALDAPDLLAVARRIAARVQRETS